MSPIACKKTKKARAPSGATKCRQRKVIQADTTSISSDLEPEPEPDNLSKTKCGCTVKTPAAPDEVCSAAVPHLKWTDEHIDLVITWCEDNPEDCQKLFSDSTQAAKDQSCQKLVSKMPKLYYHTKIATHVFSVNTDAIVHADFKKNLTCYVKPVDNLLTRLDTSNLLFSFCCRLKSEYHEVNERIGKTGASLSTDDIVEDSELWNVIGECMPMWQVKL